MYPEHIEQYFVPKSVSEVTTLLGQHPDAILLAGGQSLLPLLKARALSARTLVDLNRVDGLSEIVTDGGRLQIGALARYCDVLRDANVQYRFAALVDAISAIGDRQVRNRGTVVGSLAHGDHTGDIAPVALIFDARLELVRTNGERISTLFETYADQPAGEFIQAIGLQNTTAASAFIKHGRVAQDRAILSVAAAFACDDQDRYIGVRIALGGVQPGAMRLVEVEDRLEAATVDTTLTQDLGKLAAATVVPQDDELASADYRTQLIRVAVPAVIENVVARTRRPAQ